MPTKGGLKVMYATFGAPSLASSAIAAAGSISASTIKIHAFTNSLLKTIGASLPSTPAKPKPGFMQAYQGGPCSLTQVSALLYLSAITRKGIALMKALLCKALGPAQDLVLEEVQSPTPKKNEILLEVHAAGVNFPTP